jgi:large subunit ribosomal protein L5
MAHTTLQEKYTKEVTPALREKFGYKNIYEVPKVSRIVINSGVGKLINARKGNDTVRSEEDIIKDLIDEMTLIIGQRPHIVRAKKSIAGFKLREGTIAGVHATLRGQKMLDFLSRFVNIDLPRTRDFRGIDEGSIDNKGSMSIGVREQIIFPEIPHDKVRQMWGMQVTIVTTAKTKEEGLELLRGLGVPFGKK